MALIELTDVKKTCGKGDTEVHAIRGITTSIDKGEIVVILGKSGSGKSTLLSLLGGLEQPTEGTVMFGDLNLGKMSEDELARMRRTEVGIIFQHFLLMDSMTSLDNIELPLLISGESRSERRKWAMEVLQMVDLRDKAAHFPNELSGGERQRIGIARAFANRASVIIADEPTGDLDSKKGEEIINLLHDLNKGGEKYPLLDWNPTIIMVTHDIGMLRLGMRVITISDGLIVLDAVYDGNSDKFDPLGPSNFILETEVS